jgi:transmembrane sensor
VLVSEGQALRVDPSKPVLQKAELDPAHLRRHLAWREGLIMLDGEMLGDAAAAFNAYGGRQIVVAPEVADRRVVGVFRIRDAEGFARANASLLSLQISESGDEIRLSPSQRVMENSQ